MLFSLILLLVQFLRQSCIVADGTYECGEHGRFEYCIDEIPGCVIGCHCHPGYYFDTDTKICEPNSKLLQYHRRYNIGEPTRILQLEVTDVTTDAGYEIETKTVNNINSHVNEISKNADDLGDWLYNQFFKTIESQVVNNTNEKKTLTRRSGSKYNIKKPKRTNKWRKGKKTYKKRRRNDRLKKKLLRITENDSIFDLESSSSSDSSESSSSVSSEEIYSKHNVHDDDNEHGHKKIVMINKKEKPPLPSFVFLPNLDTSFYPPIGLPPPPQAIVPMYPMVPVPPVVPLFHLQDAVTDKCETSSISNNTTSKTSVATSVTTVSQTTTSIETNIKTEFPSTMPPENNITKDAALRNLMQRERKRKESRQRNKNRDIELGLSGMKPSERQKILQRLKGKIKKTPKLIKTSLQLQENEAEVPLLDNNLQNDMNNEIQFKPLQEEIASLPENVDFKYITELIHEGDLQNKTDYLPPIEYNPLDSIEVFRPPKSHKNYYKYYNSPLNAFDGRRTNRPTEHKTNDLYYTNLGKQIATMIKGIDSQNDQMKMEMEGTNQKISNDPNFNINSQKSFWERSVRSPLKFLNANKNKFKYLTKSNEILFNIENKVEVIASTAPALSLQEIENIVKVMEAAKIDIQSINANVRNTISSNKNLDINLWPQEIKISNKNKNEEPLLNPDINKRNKIISKNDQTDNTRKIQMHNFHRFENARQNAHSIENLNIRQYSETRKPSRGNTYFVSDSQNYNQIRYGVVKQRQPKPRLLTQKPLPQPLLENGMNPLFLKHRKYFQDKNNIVFNQNANISFLQAAKTSMGSQPSYFHNELNQLEYFL